MSPCQLIKMIDLTLTALNRDVACQLPLESSQICWDPATSGTDVLAFPEWMSSRNVGCDVWFCKLNRISLNNLCHKVIAVFMRILWLLRNNTNHILKCDRVFFSHNIKSDTAFKNHIFQVKAFFHSKQLEILL